MLKVAVPAGGRAVASGGALTVGYLLPVFLTGALSVLISQDLGFGATELGFAVAAFWGTAAVLSPPLGVVADRLGAMAAMRISMAIAALAAIGIASTATSWLGLALWLGVAGGGLAIGQPAANRLLSAEIRPQRLGTAFGLKQSAPPLGSLLAGVSVPIVTVVVGWRVAFVAAACLASLVAAGLGRDRPSASTLAPPPNGRLADHKRLVGLAIAFSCATAAASGVTTFFVGSAVESGIPPANAGLMLAAASACAIAVRIGVGVASDYVIRRHFLLCGALLGVGSVGVAGIGSGNTLMVALGVLVALAGAWGFPGVMWFAVIRLYPQQPGKATGVLAPGALLGGTIGPLALGSIIDAFGYRTAWLLAATMTAVAALAITHVGARLGSKSDP